MGEMIDGWQLFLWALGAYAFGLMLLLGVAFHRALRTDVSKAKSE